MSARLGRDRGATSNDVVVQLEHQYQVLYCQVSH